MPPDVQDENIHAFINSVNKLFKINHNEKITFIIFHHFLLLDLQPSSQKTQLLHFYVEAGNYQRINTPVSVDIEGVAKSDTLGYQLLSKR